jgi:hypothetical protein
MDIETDVEVVDCRWRSLAFGGCAKVFEFSSLSNEALDWDEVSEVPKFMWARASEAGC